MPTSQGIWRSWEGMRKLWISVEFPYRRRTGAEGGRIRLGKDRRVGVCGGGRVHRLVWDWWFKPNPKTSKCVRSRLTVDVYRVSGSAGAKCAGGIDEEYLMRRT